MESEVLQVNKRTKKKKKKQFRQRMLKSIDPYYSCHGYSVTIEQVIKHHALTIFMMKLANQHEGTYRGRNLKRALKSFYTRTYRKECMAHRPYNYQRFSLSRTRPSESSDQQKAVLLTRISSTKRLSHE